MFILILGLGRTGNHLSQLLKAQDFQVAGTTRSEEKAREMSALGVIPVRWDSKNGTANLPDADVIVCAFPPNEFYAIQMTALAMRYPSNRIIQISTTSVFGKNQGRVDEDTRPLPDSASQQTLLEAEDIILKHPLGQVIRAGGLYDDDSHPINFLAGKENINDPMAPVNLIHREDLAEILFDVVTHKINERIVHAVNPHHPPKAEYYTRKAQEKNLAPPLFSSIQETNKEITTSLTRKWRTL